MSREYLGIIADKLQNIDSHTIQFIHKNQQNRCFVFHQRYGKNGLLINDWRIPFFPLYFFL
jgi:hypothetical protein